MRDPLVVMNSLKTAANRQGYKYKRLYRNLYNQEFFLLAYNNIYSKPGNMTAGIDSKTIDGMNMDRIDKIITELRTGKYKPNPVRREYINKKDGKKRPLGIPSIDDKLIQEVIRMILESIWEDTFLNSSHGFRPNKSCHTALTSIKKTFNGTKWFVEGDIKSCFDNIDHHRLVNILRKRVKDEQFIGLIWKYLKAGYLENWEYNVTYSGVPQGSIISPILANIYLNELDKYMAEYKKEFDCGTRRERNSEYRKLESKKYLLKKQYSSTWGCLSPKKKKEVAKKIKEIEKAMLKTPATNPIDPNYKRVAYIRYADDFLVGIIGSKKDAENIKRNISNFVKKKLDLEMSEKKTLITHSKKKARFLGFDITIKRNNTPKRNKNGVARRVYNNAVKLYVPKEIWVKKLLEYQALLICYDKNEKKEKWLPISRRQLQNKKAINIVKQYNQEVRGLYNYYQIAHNVSILHKFNYFMHYSMLRTLAEKYSQSVRKVRKSFDIDGQFGVKYSTNTGEKVLLYYNGGFKRKGTNNNIKKTDIKAEYKYPFGKFSPAYRLYKQTCELCGVTNVAVTMYHVKKLTEIKADTSWHALMLENNRKTLAACEHCYSTIKAS